MPIMYDRELKLLGATGSIVGAKAIKASEGDDKGRLTFELHLLIKGSTEWSKLVTSHNKTRLFPNLNFLYSLVMDSCPSIDAVQVVISRDS